MTTPANPPAGGPTLPPAPPVVPPPSGGPAPTAILPQVRRTDYVHRDHQERNDWQRRLAESFAFVVVLFFVLRFIMTKLMFFFYPDVTGPMLGTVGWIGIMWFLMDKFMVDIPANEAWIGVHGITKEWSVFSRGWWIISPFWNFDPRYRYNIQKETIHAESGDENEDEGSERRNHQMMTSADGAGIKAKWSTLIRPRVEDLLIYSRTRPDDIRRRVEAIIATFIADKIGRMKSDEIIANRGVISAEAATLFGGENCLTDFEIVLGVSVSDPKLTVIDFDEKTAEIKATKVQADDAARGILNLQTTGKIKNPDKASNVYLVLTGKKKADKSEVEVKGIPKNATTVVIGNGAGVNIGRN